MAEFNPRPWEVPYETWQVLDATLKPNDETIKASIRLSKRLKKKYGHVVGHLYLNWKASQTTEEIKAWWAQYDAYIAAIAARNEEFETPKVPQTTTAEHDLPAV